MALYFISQENFLNLLKKLHSDYSVILPYKKNDTIFYRSLLDFSEKHETSGGETSGAEKTGFDVSTSNGAQLCLGEVRAFDPLKTFIYRAREIVAEDFKDIIPAERGKPLCIAGVKGCDLKGFQVLDEVFLSEDYHDPFYKRNRNDSLLFAFDCTCALDTCFCTALNDLPYPQKNYDINFSIVDDGYVAESGSEKGTRILENNTSLFSTADDKAIQQRDDQRKRVTDEVENNVREHEIPRVDSFNDMIQKNFESNIWKEEAETCVECGACNTICPTCHCFLLYDQKDEKTLNRLRVWDSCMIKDFARVAGGANPRPELWMRLRNRFEKKFDYFPKANDVYACTGCGRCILACPAKIDIREVLRRLTENV